MQLRCLIAVALFTSAEAGLWGLTAKKPLSGFLGDKPEFRRLQESENAGLEQQEFKVESRVTQQRRHQDPVIIDQKPISMPKKESNTTGNAFGNSTTQKETTVAKKEMNATSSGSVSPASDEPAKRPRKKARGNREATLIESLQHIGGEETVGCVTHCRYGEEMRHTWKECLERCVENRLMRSTMLDMLPEEDQKAQSMEAAVPTQLQEKLENHRKRSAEL